MLSSNKSSLFVFVGSENTNHSLPSFLSGLRLADKSRSGVIQG